MKIAGRSVSMFRTHEDAMIVGTKSMKAHTMSDPFLMSMNIKTIVTDNEQALYVSLTRNGKLEEHVVPMSNVQSYRLEPLTVKDKVDTFQQIDKEIKTKGQGRWPKKEEVDAATKQETT